MEQEVEFIRCLGSAKHFTLQVGGGAKEIVALARTVAALRREQQEACFPLIISRYRKQ